MKNVKMNPFIRVFDAIRDEKLDIIFDSKEWIEIKDSDWKRLEESQTKQGEIIVPTFVAEGEGMGEVLNIVGEKIEDKVDDEEWHEAEEEVIVEEEE
tara:strand:+ start:1175 stop:1465 length:291 start_codon:yes stop_codon:yes gene_type:complete